MDIDLYKLTICSLIGVSVLLAGCEQRGQQDVRDTGAETACSVDSDCWCGRFNGAEFSPGKAASKCCDSSLGSDDPSNTQDGTWDCMKEGFCANCRYK